MLTHTFTYAGMCVAIWSGNSTVSLDSLATQIGQRLEEASVADVMTRDPITIAGNTPVSELSKLMAERGVHRLPVVEAGVPLEQPLDVEVLVLQYVHQLVQDCGTPVEACHPVAHGG